MRCSFLDRKDVRILLGSAFAALMNRKVRSWCLFLPNWRCYTPIVANSAVEDGLMSHYNISKVVRQAAGTKQFEVKMEKTLYDYYSNVTAKPIDWLWYPYIPFGKLTVIQGDPGEGKSTFVLSLISLLTNGLPMPDGYAISHPHVAIYQCAEDGMADTIKPRLEQAGANCDKVAYIVDNDIALTLEDGRIEAAIEATGASVFIVDPIQAFIPPEADMQSATKMRSVLRRLASTAEKHHCAVILIGHMNKGSGIKTLYRGLGSIDIAAIARSVLMISRDENRPGIRYMYPIKSSLAPEGPAIAFSFKMGGGLEWHGRYEINSAALMNSVTIKTSKRDKARAKLIQLLEREDKPAKEVYSCLAGIGIGSRTVEKAKKELQIETYRLGGCWYWKLPNINKQMEKGK